MEINTGIKCCWQFLDQMLLKIPVTILLEITGKILLRIHRTVATGNPFKNAP